MRSSRTQAGKAHENGDVEQSHHRLKRAIEQELLLRCSRDFSSREEYEGFVAVIGVPAQCGPAKAPGRRAGSDAPVAGTPSG